MDIYENSESINKLNNFWETAKIEITQIKTDQITFKSQDLPLARIKKIMKLDEDVKTMMISAEAPILFAKAAEFFIREITLRAWIHTERNKRRTLQRSDITLAVADGDTDQFDFLIDIVPRDDIKTHGSSSKREESAHSQPMAQVAGNLNLFSGNTIQLNTGGLSTGQIGLVDSSSISVGAANLIQAQGTPGTVSVQNQQHGSVQYVLQLPIGANNTLSGGQTIQIQMLPQSMISNSSDNNTTQTTLTTSGTVLNGQQQQPHIFAIGSNQTAPQTATVVLQPGIIAGPAGASIYSATTSSIDPQQSVISTVANTTAAVTTDGDQNSAPGHYVLASIKRDVEEPVTINQEGI